MFVHTVQSVFIRVPHYQVCTFYLLENNNDFLIHCYYGLPHEVILEILYHPVIPSFTALVSSINVWLKKTGRMGEWVWPWWKAKQGREATPESGPSPARKHTNLKIKGSFSNPNHISDECVNDLSTISLKFHFISSTGKKNKLGHSSLAQSLGVPSWKALS